MLKLKTTQICQKYFFMFLLFVDIFENFLFLKKKIGVKNWVMTMDIKDQRDCVFIVE
jgi:hypothetical protein